MPTADIVSRGAGYTRHAAVTRPLASMLAIAGRRDRTDAIDEAARLFADPSVSMPGCAGTKNGSVTWTGATGGPYLNGWTNQLLNTNYLLYSQDFSNAAWIKSNTSVEANTAGTLAPDGTQTASKVTNLGSVSAVLRQVHTAISTGYTVEVFIKKGSAADKANRFLWWNTTTATELMHVSINLDTGVVTTIAGAGTAYAYSAGDGWWRVVMTQTAGLTVGNVTGVYVGFVGSGADAGAGAYSYIWGAQLEPGNVATPYVPTLAAAAAHPCYVRRAFPGFSVPRIPQVAQNLLVNSVLTGGGAGSPGTAPTSWVDSQITGSLDFVSVDGRLAAAFTCSATRRAFQQAQTAPTYGAIVQSCRVLANNGVSAQQMMGGIAVPAGGTAFYRVNGVNVGNGATAYPVAGDRLEYVTLLNGTGGAYASRFGAGVNSNTTGSCTLADFQTESSASFAYVASTYLPTTTVARIALDAPFRHDFRHGQNMLVNSALGGAVAGSPGTAPTSWDIVPIGTGVLSAVGAGSITYSTPAIGDRVLNNQVVTVVANTTYRFSVRVLSLVGSITVNQVVYILGLPAGAALTTYTINGAVVAGSAVIQAGDVVSLGVAIAGTAGTVTVRIGLGTTGGISAPASVTLAEPQVEVGTVRSVYTPTTTAAINAIVCEPVRASEQGVYVEWHAQGARTNLLVAPTSTIALASNTLAGVSRSIVEDTATNVHRASSPAAVAISSTYSRRFVVSNIGATRSVQVLVRDNAGGGANFAGVLVNAVTGAVSDVSAGWATANRSSVAVPGGWLVTFTITTTATLVGTVLSYYSLYSGSSNYAGDGVSGVTITGDTLEAATFPGLPLGEGVTRAADVITHNFASLRSTTGPGEDVGIGRPYSWSAAAGGAVPHASGTSVILAASGVDSASDSMSRATTDSLRTRSNGASVFSGASALADASGVARMVSRRWVADSVRMYRGTAVADTDATTGGYVARPTMTIAVNTTVDHYHGAVTAFEFNGRTATDGERALLANALDGKTQAIAA